MTDLNYLLTLSAETGLELQEDNGKMPKGNNGPWNDEETSVRNTSHWCITFLEAYEITGDERFLEAGSKAGEYLLREELRPENETFRCRTNPEKDRCNGLIGQAWVIEALSKAYEATGKETYHDTAVELFLKHPFDPVTGLWKTVEIDGEVLGYDTTFNHQLWFAASGSLLKDREVKSQVERFMDRLEPNFSVHENGLVRHKLSADLGKEEVLEALKHRKLDVLDLKIREIHRRWKRDEEKLGTLKERAVGYHAFNLYGFAVLYQNYRDHPFWETQSFREAVEAINSDEYRSKIDENMYGYPYNPPGIENAYALQVFESDEDKTRKWLEEQFKKTFNFQTGLMEQKASDRETCSARIYEATRIENMELGIENHE